MTYQSGILRGRAWTRQECVAEDIRAGDYESAIRHDKIAKDYRKQADYLEGLS